MIFNKEAEDMVASSNHISDPREITLFCPNFIPFCTAKRKNYTNPAFSVINNFL